MSIWKASKCCIYIKSIWYHMSFMARVLLLIFCPYNLHWRKWAVKVYHLKLCYHQFLHLCLLMLNLLYVFRCSYIGFIYIYNGYILFLEWILDNYVMLFLVPCCSLCFQFYLVWYKYCHSSFLDFTARNFFTCPLSFSLCVSRFEVSLLRNIYIALFFWAHLDTLGLPRWC